MSICDKENKHVLLKKTYKVSIFLLIFFCIFSVFLVKVPPAFAWKPTTHVYLAEQAREDAIDDGKVTINKINSRGEIISKVGDYNVDPNILQALKSNPAQYRAGVIGPDAYPDILTGQQVIHPETNPKGTNGWLEYLWDNSDESPAVKSFVVGYLTHAAGDIYGHTFINNFSGDAFTFTPKENAIKHIVLEGYFDKRLPSSALNSKFFNVSISGVENFIYHNLIDARRGTFLNQKLITPGGKGTDYSIPRIYSTLRNILESNIQRYRDKLSEYDKRAADLYAAADNCELTDFSCSKVLLKAEAEKVKLEKQIYAASNKPITTYYEFWIRDIDRGLKKWSSVSHKVAIQLFFNPSRKSNVDEAQDILEDYAINHLLSMSGAPDVAGNILNEIGNIADIISTIIPDALLEPIRKIKEDILNTLLQQAIGMNKEELKKYLTNPEQYFDQVMNRTPIENAENVTLQRFNREYLKINDSGFNQPNESFDYKKVPAAYNTVVISKLLLLPPNEINRLLQDLGDNNTLTESNIMLGFVKTLDGSNEQQKMVLAQKCEIYRKLFVKQAREDFCMESIATPSNSTFIPILKYLLQ